VSVRRTYSCDLCSDVYEPNDPSLIGLHWSGSGRGCKVSSAPTRNVEHHICRPCLNWLVEAHSAIAAAEQTAGGKA
jgi:hypothetical protein